MILDADLLGLLRGAAPCFVATVMPDGAPQLTQTWVDTDGTHILINTVDGFQKLRNWARDPRVALNVCDPERITRYYAIRGRVIATTAEGGAEHIDELARRYTGEPYQWYGGRDQVRVKVTIDVDSARELGG